MYDIVALGELLVDFIQEGMNEEGHPVFSANPGGAPCNIQAVSFVPGNARWIERCPVDIAAARMWHW